MNDHRLLAFSTTSVSDALALSNLVWPYSEESNKPQRRGRIGEDRSIEDEVQVLNVDAERNSKVLGREK